MHWQKMAEQVAAIQNAAEESDCDSDIGSISNRPSDSQTSEARELLWVMSTSVDLTWKHTFHRT